MSVLVLYSVFCLTTAIVALKDLLYPVMRTQTEAISNPVLIPLVFFIISILIAPLVFLSCIVPSMGDKFREALETGLFPKA